MNLLGSEKVMKKTRFLSAILVLFTLFALFPLTAFGADAKSVYVFGRELSSGEYLAEGADMPTTTKPSGGYAYFYVESDGEAVLLLHNYNLDAGAETAIYSNGDLTLVLSGKNSLTSVRGNLVHIFGNLRVSGDGTLEIGGGTSCSIYVTSGDFVQEGGNLLCNGIDSGVCANDGNVYINGGTLTATSSYGEAIYAMGEIVFSSEMRVSASENIDGSEIEEYDASKNSSYKYIFCEPVQKGDVNDDGAVDMFDYMLVKSYYFDRYEMTEQELSRADVSSDGTVDVFDYIAIKGICFGRG